MFVVCGCGTGPWTYSTASTSQRDAALLPDSAVAAEIGESWRTLETVGVLGVWAIAGLLLAPVVPRRMARRESGSAMEERRQRAMQRIGG